MTRTAANLLHVRLRIPPGDARYGTWHSAMLERRLIEHAAADYRVIGWQGGADEEATVTLQLVPVPDWVLQS